MKNIQVAVRINLPGDEFDNATCVCIDRSIVSGKVAFNEIPPGSWVEVQPDSGEESFSIQRQSLILLS